MFQGFLRGIQMTSKSFGVFRRVFHWFSPEFWKYTRRVLFWQFFAVIISTLHPLLVQQLLDGVINRQRELVILGIVGLVLFMFLEPLGHYVRRISREHVQGWFDRSLLAVMVSLYYRKALIEHIQEGTILTEKKMWSGHNRLEDIVREFLFSTIQFTLELFLAFLLLFIISPIAGCIAMGYFIVYGVWIVTENTRVIEEKEKIEKEWTQYYRYFGERISMVRMVKMFAMEKEELKTLQGKLESVTTRDIDLWSWYIKQAFWRDVLSHKMVVVLIAFGVWQVWEGALSVGALFPLMVWASRIRMHMGYYADFMRQFNKNIPAVKILLEGLEAPPKFVDAVDAVAIQKFHGKIEFDRVSYSYEDEDEKKIPVLRDVSFVIHPADRVAVIGKSGAGKSTMGNLLKCFDRPSTGRILVDGVDLSKVTVNSWLQRMGFIPQDIDLMDGTIEYNLKYGIRRQVSDKELDSVMERCQINEFGRRLVLGKDTKIGEDGIQLSGGQRQRMAWGMAFLRDPEFVIIDEGTSNLDAKTESMIMREFEELTRGKTTFIIAHRLATLKTCTRFFVVKPLDELQEGEPQVQVFDSFDACRNGSPVFQELIALQELR